MKRDTTEMLLIVGIIVMAANLMLNFFTFLGPADLIPGKQSGTAQVNVPTRVSMRLNVNTVNFGSLDNGQSDNTLDAIPAPFEIENTGNVKADINIGATDLWTEAPNPSLSFQFQSAEKESGSVDAPADLVLSWTNIPPTASAVKFATHFNSRGNRDELYGHISLLVPADEASGAKTATVTFTASQAAP